jgi:hypothetical protein
MNRAGPTDCLLCHEPMDRDVKYALCQRCSGGWGSKSWAWERCPTCNSIVPKEPAVEGAGVQ